MKSALDKYFYPCLAGIIIEVIVLFVVLVENFRMISGIADAIYIFFSNNPILRNIFDFLADWAIVMCVVPILAVLLLLLIDIRNVRRSRALGRIHDWAQNVVRILADYRQRDRSLQESPSMRYEGIKVLIDALMKQSNTALSDAKVVGGKLEAKTQKAVRKFYIINEKVDKYDESAYDDLRILQYDLSDVMISTFEKLHNS